MGGFILGKSFHAFHNRTHKASPPIPSGSWCWLFFFCMPRLSCVRGLQRKLAARLGPKNASLCRELLPSAARLLSALILPSISSIFKPFQLSVTWMESNCSVRGETAAADTQSTSYSFPLSLASQTVTSSFTLTETRQHIHMHTKL